MQEVHLPASGGQNERRCVLSVQMQHFICRCTHKQTQHNTRYIIACNRSGGGREEGGVQVGSLNIRLAWLYVHRPQSEQFTCKSGQMSRELLLVLIVRFQTSSKRPSTQRSSVSSVRPGFIKKQQPFSVFVFRATLAEQTIHILYIYEMWERDIFRKSKLFSLYCELCALLLIYLRAES